MIHQQASIDVSYTPTTLPFEAMSLVLSDSDKKTAVFLENKLKAFLNNQNAEFSCSGQLQALLYLFKRLGNCIIRLPTGYGKSMLFELCAKSLMPTKLTIVVQPFIALIKQTVRKAEERQIGVEVWRGPMIIKDSTSLLLVSADLVGVENFSKYASI